MPWPAGPVQVGANGENHALHEWVDGAAARIATPATSVMGSYMENLLGHRSGGTNKAAPWYGSPAAAAAGVETDGGVSTATAAATLTDALQTWVVNTWTNFGILCVGAGVTGGQFNVIASNTATVITGKSNWGTQPGATSTYYILALADQNQGGTVTYGAGPANAVVDTAKAWVVNQWRGLWVMAVTAAGAEARQIVSNTATQLTLDKAWVNQPGANVAYGIMLPLAMGWNELQRGAGSTAPLGSPRANSNNPEAL